MIELVSPDRCNRCDACVDACPDDVFDRTPSGVPAIARFDDCQTCFLCELYCPVDAIYVSPFRDARESVDEAALVSRGLCSRAPCGEARRRPRSAFGLRGLSG